MASFWQSVVFAFNVMLPNILLLLLGFGLQRIGYLNAAFCEAASKMLFLCSLPMLLFLGILKGSGDYSAELVLLGAGIVSTFVIFGLSELAAWLWVKKPQDKGVFVQGVYRGNLAIIGLSLCANAYGERVLATAAVFTGVITILYNILAVITLSRSGGKRISLKPMLMKILTNPLIIGIVVALIVQQLHIHIPQPLLSTGRYLGNLALPLALICAGASFNVKTLFRAGDISLVASAGRLLFAPLVASLIGLAFGLSGMHMGVLFLMSATPVAAASYVMTLALGGNATAAANIIGITTFGSMLTTSLGIIIMRSFNFI